MEKYKMSSSIMFAPKQKEDWKVLNSPKNRPTKYNTEKYIRQRHNKGASKFRYRDDIGKSAQLAALQIGDKYIGFWGKL